MTPTRNRSRAGQTLNRVWLLALTVSLVLSLAACGREDTGATPPETAPPRPDSWLITNVTVIDGTGYPRFAGSVRINGSRIIDVGVLEPLPHETAVDGGGQVLAPGFIDTHSHADSDIFELPDAEPAVSQGITTAIVGQDGSSPWPLSDFTTRLEQDPVALNLASYAGHNTLRAEVMGDDYRRAATDAELERMETLLLAELEAGALGLATGLEYDPGIYSQPDEVLQLARLAAGYGGRYISHMRSEDRWLNEAIEEILHIGRETGMPVQISHFKLAMKSLWGTADDILTRLDAARAEGIEVTADIYPYEYWQSNMMVLLPERDITDRDAVTFALGELAPPEGLWMTQFDPDPSYVGKTLSEIANLRGTDPVTAFMDLIAESAAMEAETGEPADAIIGTSMSEADIVTLLEWEHTNVCTDGGLVDLHPRARGSYPRVLGRYVRDQKAMSLETAVHKMSGLAADHMGITDRGRIEAGQAADLVLFDPQTVSDHATPDRPEALSSGITTVWVNGKVVWKDGAVTGERPGIFLRRR
ncbi:N-acyl-D-amino-acid deacylase family protein [Elongatibacter sediminis]|uniref:D-aminoacylase n=1 Tax=Elongatibacter sediminis TaxID=3119006 RepID=A0AAW9R8I6_9GAMM